MTACDDALAALAQYTECSLTEDGARLRTHCLYPSFEPVYVFVSPVTAGGYYVHDGGNAYAVAWDHGRDERAAMKAIEQEARRFDTEVQGVGIGVRVPDAAWLESAILAVANGSAHAAMSAVRKFVAATESALKERIGIVLDKTIAPLFEVAHEYTLAGKSGKEHTFDFAIKREGLPHFLVIDAVSPHHSSISHRFVAFSDTKSRFDGEMDAFAVFDKALDHEDAALIQQVAELVPFGALERGTLRTVNRFNAF